MVKNATINTDQIIQKARFKIGSWVNYDHQSWKIHSIAYNPQNDKLLYILERHDHCEMTVTEDELSATK